MTRARSSPSLAASDRTITEVAAGIGTSRKRFTKLLRIAMLAPDIVVRCLNGQPPAALTNATLLGNSLQACWMEQRQLPGIA